MADTPETRDVFRMTVHLGDYGPSTWSQKKELARQLHMIAEYLDLDGGAWGERLIRDIKGDAVGVWTLAHEMVPPADDVAEQSRRLRLLGWQFTRADMAQGWVAVRPDQSLTPVVSLLGDAVRAAWEEVHPPK